MLLPVIESCFEDGDDCDRIEMAALAGGSRTHGHPRLIRDGKPATFVFAVYLGCRTAEPDLRSHAIRFDGA